MVKHVPPIKWDIDREVLEIDGVPTVAGLLRMNLARRTTNGIQISHQGHALMGKRLRENARRDMEQKEESNDG